MKYGTVYWITGLSCAGKTTIGRLTFEKIKSEKDNVVFLDGDILRDVFGNDLGYTIEDRKKGAIRNSRLCKMLSDQGIDVVCATIGMFNNVRKWNLENIKNYKEVFLNVPREVLLERDVKGLYRRALSGQEKNVVGIDIEAEFPVNPHIEIVNDGSRTPQEIVELIINNII